MIKLVAIDLDGTVVNNQLQISEQVVKDLQRAQNEFGVKVIIATGRMFPSTLKFSEMVGIRNPIISYQGAMIREITEPKTDISHYPTMYHQGLDIETAEELINIIDEHQYHANIYVDDKLYTNQINEKSWYYKSITGVTPIHEPNFKNLLDGIPSKVMLIDDECKSIADELKDNFKSRLHICLSRKDFCEIVHPEVSKWKAIEHLMQLWNLDKSEVMAIGDQENDIPMILGAGVGVAMGNAPQNIQAMADFITKPIAEDGVSFALNEFVFKPSQN